MSKNILKLCFTALLFVSSFTVSAQHYNFPSEAEVLDYWREYDNEIIDNEADVRLLYDKAVRGDPDALFLLSEIVRNIDVYKGIYVLIQAKEKGSERALRYIQEDDPSAYKENWFQIALNWHQILIREDESDGEYSSLSLDVACQYFIPDPEGYLGPTYYSENQRELSKLNTGRHGCEPYDNKLRDYAKARHYFSRVVDFSLPKNNASDIDVYRATQALGVIYRDGLGVPVDKGAAAFYFMATREAE